MGCRGTRGRGAAKILLSFWPGVSSVAAYDFAQELATVEADECKSQSGNGGGLARARRRRKSALGDGLDRGAGPTRFWRLMFYFFSRFILGFCVLHYFGVAFPQSRWVFPGPDSQEFWEYCALMAFIFAVVFYVIRRIRAR